MGKGEQAFILSSPAILPYWGRLRILGIEIPIHLEGTMLRAITFITTDSFPNKIKISTHKSRKSIMETNVIPCLLEPIFCGFMSRFEQRGNQARTTNR